ncbi:MAG TPA: exodeoxyribonuclease III [Rhodopila sp.]|uniref:exodeoxyribonuclease III n=1 Tax=Rhodopila sp. TaxID=2480087 RepID=UPI002B9816C1|nr:exodeoxyribonuclease III [Rhodopila sp.]HVY15988.1 exodeoxyribonuclease III [Rhodopila sp.]
MKVATWNVNSIRQREGHVQRWLEACQPDVLFLQEIKCEATSFPSLTYHGFGYTSEVVGQKSYNGVAALCRHPFTVTHTALPGLPDGDVQARYVEIETQDVTLIGIYAPNGNSRGDEGFAYKLAWMDCLAARAAELLKAETPFLITGDYNICPTDEDYAPGALPPTDALVRLESRQRWRRMLWLGLTDAVRALHPHGAHYTFWDYQGGAWQRDMGLRIDHALLSPEMAERLVAAEPDKQERDRPQPSDHVPVMFTFQ